MFRKSDSIYWLWLSLKIENQNSLFQKLIDVFGESPYDIYKAKKSELEACSFLNKPTVDKLCDKSIDEAMSVFKYCGESGVGLLTYNDPMYPESLKNIKKPPMVLYYIGRLPELNKSLSVSVVGTRKMTEYGMRSSYKLSYELASAGVVIVSGMALGIDAMAHAGAISAGGKTIAVLGCGIDVLYPKQHRRLRSIIANNGAVITAYRPGTPAYKANFPERNAIISGLSSGTLVVEAPIHSGAMTTASLASEQSRVLYALPGSVEEPTSDGPNQLIKDGAVAVTCARDILSPYFEGKSVLVDPVRFRFGECNSTLEREIVEQMGISLVCSGEGPKETPAELLRKLNQKLNSNEGENKEYYKTPKIKRISDEEPAEEHTDVSAELLESLSEAEKNIFLEFPIGKPVPVDAFAKMGYSIGDVMSSLTMLEINGLISSLPGGLYIRR